MAEEKKVVVIASDGSDHAKLTLQKYATEFYKPGDFAVVVYVATYTEISYGSVALIPGDPALVQRIVESEEIKCTEVVKKLSKELVDLKIEGEVVRVNGEPGPAILEKAKDLKAVYIVVGSRGLGKIRRTIMGSVSDYLVHHAHIPVVVCKSEHHHHHHGGDSHS